MCNKFWSCPLLLAKNGTTFVSRNHRQWLFQVVRVKLFSWNCHWRGTVDTITGLFKRCPSKILFCSVWLLTIITALPDLSLAHLRGTASSSEVLPSEITISSGIAFEETRFLHTLWSVSTFPTWFTGHIIITPIVWATLFSHTVDGVYLSLSLSIYIYIYIFVGSRPGIYYWLKFQPLKTRAMAKSSYRGDSRSKMTCHCRSLRAETSTKIWMNGLNPNYNTTRPNSGLNIRNCCRKVRARDSLLNFATPSWFCRSHQKVHSLRRSSLNYSRLYFMYG